MQMARRRSAAAAAAKTSKRPLNPDHSPDGSPDNLLAMFASCTLMRGAPAVRENAKESRSTGSEQLSDRWSHAKAGKRLREAHARMRAITIVKCRPVRYSRARQVYLTRACVCMSYAPLLRYRSYLRMTDEDAPVPNPDAIETIPEISRFPRKRAEELWSPRRCYLIAGDRCGPLR